MEELGIVNHQLRAARDKLNHDLDLKTTELANKENRLKERSDQIQKKKLKITHDNGNVGAADDDLIEVNAGGKIVAAKRSTLTQPKGTRFEALFSGRWDEKLQRDGRGRIFLDVNPVCFEAIVDYLSEMAISSEDNPPGPPSVDNEHKLILQQQLELFGLLDMLTVEMPDSNIVKDVSVAAQLHEWLNEDGSDGEFSLLYCSSRDGSSGQAFHSKCDNQGSTLTLIETTDGFVIGGYSNTPWSSDGSFRQANKAFLFVLSGNDISSPSKMKLKSANDGNAVFHCPLYGPAFGYGNGHDLYVYKASSNVNLHLGTTYESGPSQLRSNNGYKTLAIKEMEVFQVSGTFSWAPTATTKEKQIQPQILEVEPVTIFSEGVNKAISTKQETLIRAESEILHLENGFKDEHEFIAAFASSHANDVVTLNVSGTMMATKRSTLLIADNSVLAQQFDNTKWTEQGCGTTRVKNWSFHDVCRWVKEIDDISDEVANVFLENEITGNELLALNMEGLKMIGIERAGTLCLLLDEIKLLKQASSDAVAFIEHSSYCFGKILDFLRSKHLHSQGLAGEPDLPTIDDAQKSRFEKVVKYYFPGDSAKFILG